MVTKTTDYTVTGTDGKDYCVTVTGEAGVEVTSVKPLSDGTDPINPPINPEPPIEGSIPMSFDDPMFDDDMDEKSSCVTLSNGQDLNDTSIEENSGNPSVLCHGNNKITRVRVRSRECIRITDNDLTIESAYLESQGEGDDHADTLQAYSPGARGASVTLINTHVRAHNEAATAGYFTADSWGGTITNRNVLYQGGPWGIRAISDPGCHIDVYMDGVFFVGPFHWGMFSFEEYQGGTLAIKQWRNVREATIQNGEIIPGRELTMPSKAQIAEFSRNAKPRPKRDASTGFTVPKK